MTDAKPDRMKAVELRDIDNSTRVVLELPTTFPPGDYLVQGILSIISISFPEISLTEIQRHNIDTPSTLSLTQECSREVMVKRVLAITNPKMIKALPSFGVYRWVPVGAEFVAEHSALESSVEDGSTPVFNVIYQHDIKLHDYLYVRKGEGTAKPDHPNADAKSDEGDEKVHALFTPSTRSTPPPNGTHRSTFSDLKIPDGRIAYLKAGYQSYDLPEEYILNPNE